MAEYAVNFSGKRIHYNPPWEDCNIDDAGNDVQIRSEEQIKGEEYASFDFCKICKARPRA